MKILTEKRAIITMFVLVTVALLLSSIIAFKTFTLEPGQEVVAPGGITVAKPTNNIIDATLNSNGYLIVKYEDGSTREVGYIVGQKGEKGDSGPSVAPTQAQIAIAVSDYCNQNNRCDAKSPSLEQVATAVTSYCSVRSSCQGIKGSDGSSGQNGQNATAEQIANAVSSYCSDGRCKGATGEPGASGAAGANGANGADGQNPIISCVTREVNNVSRQYIAWKYATENNDAYKDLYLLPTWAQGNSCITL